MTERLLCLDTSILIKCLATDEHTEAAVRLLEGAVRDGARLVAPAWAWAEVGSVLRKKLRAGLLQPDEARALWDAFLPIEYVDARALRVHAWEFAERHRLPTLYDAAFLACTELAPSDDADATREFWTADEKVLASLGTPRPAYVHRLGS